MAQIFNGTISGLPPGGAHDLTGGTAGFDYPETVSNAAMGLSSGLQVRGSQLRRPGVVEVELPLTGHINNQHKTLTTDIHTFATNYQTNPNNGTINEYHTSDEEIQQLYETYRHIGTGMDRGTIISTPGALVVEGPPGGGSLKNLRYMPSDADMFIGDASHEAFFTAIGHNANSGTAVHQEPNMSGTQGTAPIALGQMTALNVMWNGAMDSTNLAIASKANFHRALAKSQMMSG